MRSMTEEPRTDNARRVSLLDSKNYLEGERLEEGR